MYSNEKGSRFNILDILVKILFAAAFIFILVWLFPKVPNMTPFYSNVFRENIKYMQEAGESYFTTDKLPKEVGGSEKITLAEMFDKRLILPFVDENGNSCNQYESYVSITKTLTGYDLKTNLVCNNESNYVIKILGCHGFCEEDKVASLTEYQFKKLVSQNTTTYKCPSGYKRSGSYCVKSTVVDKKSAAVTTQTSKTDIKDAELVVTDENKVLLSTVATKVADTKIKTYVSPVKSYTSGSTTTKKEAYACQQDKVEKKCTTTTVSQAYSCNCTSAVDSTGKTVTKCNTCYKSVPKESCENIKTTYYDTCYRDVTVTTPAKTTYTCPSYATGSEGSGSSLNCYYYQTSSNGYSYTCPSNTNYSTGTGSNLLCYKVTSGSATYKCASGYSLTGDKCYKNVTGTKTTYKCASGYKLVGKECYKYSTTKKKATVKKGTKTYYTYKWSTEETLSGWTKTGKNRVVADTTAAAKTVASNTSTKCE